MRVARRRFNPTIAIVSVVVLSCKDSPGPGPDPDPPGLRFVAGNGQTDTVQAELPLALTVHVGATGPGVVVRFESLPMDSAHLSAGAFVGALTSQSFGTFIADSTDSMGNANVLVKLGTVAGTARIRITVPTHLLADTAEFTVLAGHAANVIVTPSDTVLFTGRSFQARGAVTDRCGNPRTDAVSYAAVTNLTVSTNGMVTSSAVGRGRYVVSGGGAADTGFVSIVPAGVLAAMRTPSTGPAELVMFQLDGSGLQVLTTLAGTTYEDPNPRWSPDGTKIVYSVVTSGVSRLHTVTTTGTVTRLIASPPAQLVSEIWPHYTDDGQYVYLGGLTPTTNAMIWRVASNGTGAVRISPDSVSGNIEFRPAPSPDGGRLAYVTVPGGAIIRVKYFAGDTTSTWFVAGNTPRWDPVSDRLAYVQQYGGPISVVNGDGTDAHVISAPGRGYEERTFDWSPDGQWIVARGSETLELIRVATGETLPLPYSSNMNMPIWRP